MSRRLTKVSFASFASFALVACGERSSLDGVCTWGEDCGNLPAMPDASVAPDASVIDASIVDSAPEAAPGDANADVQLPPNDLGNILITSGIYVGDGGASGSFELTGVFYDSVAATGCSRREVGACVLSTCIDSGVPSGNFAAAGTLTVTGGAISLSVEQGSGALYSQTGEVVLFNGGETLTISGSGATVPAFSASLRAPTQITVTTQAATTTPLVVDRSAPFVLGWKGTSLGVVDVELLSSAEGITEYLDCSFDVSAGVGTISADAMATLASGAGTLTVSTSNASTLLAGAWTVSSYVSANAADVNGNEMTLPVTYP